MNNPFLFGRTVSDEHFTDRKEETKNLLANIKAKVNTIIVSPRRYGKSSLVKHVALQAPKKTSFVFIDMNIRSEEEFYNTFSTKIIEATSSKLEERIQVLKKFLSSVKPSFSIGNGLENNFELSLNLSKEKKQIEEVLNLPEKIAIDKRLNIVIALDEFQNIEFFDNPLAFQKTCRSYWQNHSNVSYILYGSKQHMLTNLFQDRNSPFYRFGDVMYLKKIDTNYLIKYIIDRFKFTQKSINEDVANLLVDYVKNHPYYTQQLSYILWNISLRKATKELLQQAKNSLLDQNTIFYQSEVENISNSQINFLKMVIA